jgi:hypothetical protein
VAGKQFDRQFGRQAIGTCTQWAQKRVPTGPPIGSGSTCEREREGERERVVREPLESRGLTQVERERETDRQRDRETERQERHTQRERHRR